MSEKSILLIGTGWLGSDLALFLKEKSFKPIALGKNKQVLNKLASSNILTHLIYFKDVSDFFEIPEAPIAVIMLPPSASKETQFGSFPEMMRKLIDRLVVNGTEYILYISSTGVYSNGDGQYSELSETGNSSRQITLLEAEDAVLNSNASSAVIRSGGLCGKDRHPGLWGSSSELAGNEYVNMIWKDDLIQIVYFILKNNLKGIYNAVAPEHVERSAFYEHCFTSVSKPFHSLKNNQQAVKRIILSSKILELGFEFIYPNPCNFPI